MMLERDYGRLADAYKRTDASPIGCCALAGTTYPTDRVFEAQKLGFAAVCENSLDGVSDRDFCVELMSACALVMMHLSRLSEELILWSSWEFQFIELDSGFTTGSSIMPQKKNPDMAELCRGKTGRVYGDLIALLTTLKGLPLAYNKDMQEDKEAVFDCVDTTKLCLQIMAPMLSSLRAKPEAMLPAAQKGFINATDLADYLTKKGVPFRSAYKISGQLVAYCIAHDTVLEKLPLETYKMYSDVFTDDLYEEISLRTCVARRISAGGTGPRRRYRRSWIPSRPSSRRINKKEYDMNIKGQSFLKLLDFTPEQIAEFLALAAELKAKKKAGIPHRLCEGKQAALIFEKTSTRTRCSFEVAAHDLGMTVTYLDPSGSQIGKKESIADTARVLGRMYDGIEYRGYGQQIVEELAKYAGVPVWNGLTNEFHPTQILADFLTIQEHFGNLTGKKLVYMGDARYNMGNSLMVGCAKMGMHFVACAPEAYFPDKALIETCKAIAAQTGAVLEFDTEPMHAVQNADVIYTDVWVSMGEPDEVWQTRIHDLLPYQVNAKLMAQAGPQCRFMHCLPAFHDLNTTIGKQISEKYGLDAMEVTDEVFESSQSIVFDEAENRMHTIKAVMAATL